MEAQLPTTPYFFSFEINSTKFCQTAVHAVINRISSAEPSTLRLLITLYRCRIDVVKALLQSHTDAHRSSLSLLIQDVKEEMKSIRNDVNDLKVSLQFSQAKLDEAEKKLNNIDLTVSTHKDNLNCMNEFADFTENQLEYLENQNRRSNVRSIGLSEEKQLEKTWYDTEQLVKKANKEKLNLADDFEIERCHRVKHKSENNSRNGPPVGPHPIVAKMA